jgi:hypothetical protein
MTQIKKHRTDVNIDNGEFPFDDWKFIKERGFKPTNLLRSKIKELRKIEDGAPTIDGLLKSVNSLQEKIKELFAFIDDKGLFEDFIHKDDKKEN